MTKESRGIPKKIHYCWFGTSELPESAVRCIDSWKKYLPDYEIIQWNEENFDIKCCDYVREAYEEKQWAFVSDYARMHILYHEGGLYFDTDVEMIRPIDDIVAKGPFMGMENGVRSFINPGLGIGAYPKHEIYREIIEKYRMRHFRLNDGSLDHTTIVTFVSKILSEHGLSEEQKIQQVEGIYIYPQTYFCPMDYYTGELRITEETRTIHNYDGTWHSDVEKEAYAIKRRMSRILPETVSGPIAALIASLHRCGIKETYRAAAKRRN